MEEKKSQNKSWIIILLVISLIVFGGWKVMVSKNATNKSASSDKKMVLVDCTSTATDMPQEVAGWDTMIYPSVNNSNERQDNKTVMQESYSIAKLNDKTEANNVYYRVQLDTHTDLPENTLQLVEFCDENNKTVKFGTTKDTAIKGSSGKVQAWVAKLSPYFMQNKPGTYRMDGYLFTNGKWTLTNRVDAIKLTE